MVIEEKGTRNNKGWMILLAVFLWAFTAILGLMEFSVVRGMVLRIYATFWRVDLVAPALSAFTIMFLAIIWIGFVIGGAEYHSRNFGTPKSWKLFARTIAAEVSILLLALYI